MDVSILEDLGLTNAEIKVYLALLELGTSTAGPIVQKTKLQNSVVHLTLLKLIENGFISFIKKGGIKEYSATEPENILKFIEEKKHRFSQILPELKNKQHKRFPQEAEVYHGFKGLKNMLYSILDNSKKGDEFLFFVFDTKAPEKYEKVYNFYREEFHKMRKEKGIIEKGLAPIKLKKEVEKAKWTRKCVKFVKFPVMTNISVINDSVAFTPWDDEEISFLIKSKQLADSFKEIFYSIWNAS